MKKILKKSLELNLTEFSGKTFKILCEIIRSGIKQEHGYKATKGLTDIRFGKWPIVIRFLNNSNRTDFIDSLEDLLSTETLLKISPTKLKPIRKTTRSVRFLRCS
jgi:hypothetical protein